MSTKFKIKSSETPIFFGNGEFCPEKFFLYNFSSLPFVIDFFTDVNNVKKIIDYLNAKTKECLEKVHIKNNISELGGVYKDDWYLNTEILCCIQESRESFRGISVKIFCKTEFYFNQILEELKPYYNNTDKRESEINLVFKDLGGLYLSNYKLENIKIDDLSINYGKKFLEINDTILDFINNSEKCGMILLHGTPGTGKTSYIRYLLGKIKSKKIIYFPPYLSDVMTSPEFLPFIVENKNSVLVIEDAEKVIMSREGEGQSEGISNLLNISDGILGECVKSKVICTFNTDVKKIDAALLRKGRLIAKHKFESLSIEESKILVKHLNLDPSIVKKPMTLAEIYNYKDNNFYTEENPRQIGFNLK